MPSGGRPALRPLGRRGGCAPRGVHRDCAQRPTMSASSGRSSSSFSGTRRPTRCSRTKSTWPSSAWRRHPGPPTRCRCPMRARAIAHIGEIFRKLREEGRQIASDSHELGWLITRSREYMEYYCDEEFKGGAPALPPGGIDGHGRGPPEEAQGHCGAGRGAPLRRLHRPCGDHQESPPGGHDPRGPRARPHAARQEASLFRELIRAVRLATVFLTPGTGRTGGRPP